MLKSQTTKLTALSLAILPLAAMQFTMPQAAMAQQAAPAIAVPQAEALLVLIRSALVALDHANKTGNYSVLREIGGPGMQASSSGQLSNLFAQLRNAQVDLLATLIVTPQLTTAPAIGPQGHLQLTGFFPTRPQQISFQIAYQPINGQWRLLGLNVALTVAETASGTPAASAKAQPPLAKSSPAKSEVQGTSRAK